MITAPRNVTKPPALSPCRTLSRPRYRSSAIATAPRKSISGELIDCTATDRIFRAQQTIRSVAEPAHLPEFHAKRLHNPVPCDRLVHDVLNLGQLVLPCPRRRPHPPPNPSGRAKDDRDKQQQNPRHFAAYQNHYADHEDQREQLLQKVAHHRRHRHLHSLNVVDQRRKQRSRRMLLKKTPQTFAKEHCKDHCAGP